MQAINAHCIYADDRERPSGIPEMLRGRFQMTVVESRLPVGDYWLGSGIIGNPITYKVAGKQYVSIWSGIGGWIGLPVTAGLDLSDKFGAIGATAMTKIRIITSS